MPLRAKKLKITNQHKPIRNLSRIHISDSEVSETTDWEDYIPNSMRIEPSDEEAPMEESPFKLKKEYTLDSRRKRNLGDKKPYPDINPAANLPSPPEHIKYAIDRHAMMVSVCSYLNDAFTLTLDDLRVGTFKIGSGNSCKYKIHKKEFRGSPYCPELLCTIVVNADYDITVLFNLPVELDDGTPVESYPHVPNTFVRFNCVGTPLVLLFNEHNQFKVHDFSRNSYTRHIMANPEELVYKYDPRYKAIDARFEEGKRNVILFRLLRNNFTLPLKQDLTEETPTIRLYYTCESAMHQFVADYRFVDVHLINGEIVLDFNYSECSKWSGVRRENSSINYIKIHIKAGPKHEYY
ncbi:hypothetical protein HDV06_006378 [Boothiomyces sp. JEL0866]|nr:hypothetical protein HDV06_006378 [Boothiomyces sp. JEL0866]